MAFQSPWSPAPAPMDIFTEAVNGALLGNGTLLEEALPEEQPARSSLRSALLLAGGAIWCLRRRREQQRRKAEAAKAAALLASPADDWRFSLVRSVGEECQAERELRGLLKMKRNKFVCYDGFEPSGRMHIAQGVFKAINVNKCTKAGGTFVFWVADWFALMNDKMGGDLEKIKVVGKYLIEVWKATGMDMTRVKFLWSSDEITNNAEQYWLQALDIARRSTLARIKKCCQIMGRQEDKLTAAQIMYPIMQATDVFFLKADICQLGVDQRKVNMLARDYCDWVGRKKPVILSHHMLYGLKAGQSKMSKSDPDSAIFMEDTAEDVARKIRSSYCPRTPEAAAAPADDEMHLVKDDLMNPCLDYLRYILFSREGYVFQAGGKTYADFEEARRAFVDGELTEALLKETLIEEINKLLEPVRQHFESDPEARDLLGKVRQWKKESLTATSTLTRLQVVDEQDGTPVFAVFAPRPRETVRLAAVLDTLQRLRRAPAGARVVLWLEDWTAIALGRLGGSAAGIRSFYELLLFGLRSLATELMERVQVCWQGELILRDPSAYWISVINAGRRCSVETIRSMLPAGETLEYASQVLASLMHIGDVYALTGSGGLSLCSGEYHANVHLLAAQQCEAAGLPVPEVCTAAPEHLLQLHAASSRRGASETQAHILLTDSAAELGAKVKKAFCEPGNVGFCPPVEWVAALLAERGRVEVSRAEESGGDVVYTDAQAVREDFAAGRLHPGDLKPALAALLADLLAPASEALASQEALLRARAALLACREEQLSAA